MSFVSLGLRKLNVHFKQLKWLQFLLRTICILYVRFKDKMRLSVAVSIVLCLNSNLSNIPFFQFYDDWCDKYDEDLVVVGNYTGHTKCVEAFLKLELDRKISVLDLACGTGLLGSEVASHGYELVDGLDSRYKASIVLCAQINVLILKTWGHTLTEGVQ